MPTEIYQRGLVAYYEANELAGADGATVSSFTDLSGNGRHLTAASSQPVINTPAINSKKSILWDGTKNPLVYSGQLEIRCGFIVVKIAEAFSDYLGLLTDLTNNGILVGKSGTNLFFDFLYPYYEYRLNDHIFPKEAAFAPIGAFAIIYFKFWKNLIIDGIQLGQDRGDTSRKFNGEVAALALYNRNFCESEVRNMVAAFSNSYQIAVYDAFPYSGSKTDSGERSPIILSDDQPEPITRIKYAPRESFNLNFNDRSQTEYEAAKAYHETHYPYPTMLYRDYQHIPPVDFNIRITSAFQKSGAPGYRFNYGFSAIESNQSAGTAILAAPTIPPEEPDIPEGALFFGDEPIYFGDEIVTFI